MFFSLSLSSLFTSLTFSQDGSPKIKRKAVSVLAPFFSLLFRSHERTTTSAKSLDFIIHRVDGVNRKKKKKGNPAGERMPIHFQEICSGDAMVVPASKKFWRIHRPFGRPYSRAKKRLFGGLLFSFFSSLLARSWWIRIWSHSSIRGSTIHPR